MTGAIIVVASLVAAAVLVVAWCLARASRMSEDLHDRHDLRSAVAADNARNINDPARLLR